MKNIKYYSSEKISSLGFNFNIIFGERSNGKSYDLKHKKGVENYFKTGKRFVLVRRIYEEFKRGMVEQYFKDVDINKISRWKI